MEAQRQVALFDSGGIFVGSVKVRSQKNNISSSYGIVIQWILELSLYLQNSHHYQKGQPVSIHGRKDGTEGKGVEGGGFIIDFLREVVKFNLVSIDGVSPRPRLSVGIRREGGLLRFAKLKKISCVLVFILDLWLAFCKWQGEDEWWPKVSILI